MWISVEERLPKNQGFYLCLSNTPYSDWDFRNKKDRFNDCQTFAYFGGTHFFANDVMWWFDTEKIQRPNDWKLKE